MERLDATTGTILELARTTPLRPPRSGPTQDFARPNPRQRCCFVTSGARYSAGAPPREGLPGISLGDRLAQEGPSQPRPSRNDRVACSSIRRSRLTRRPVPAMSGDGVASVAGRARSWGFRPRAGSSGSVLMIRSGCPTMSLWHRPGVRPMTTVIGTECNTRETIKLESAEDGLQRPSDIAGGSTSSSTASLNRNHPTALPSNPLCSAPPKNRPQEGASHVGCASR